MSSTLIIASFFGLLVVLCAVFALVSSKTASIGSTADAKTHWIDRTDKRASAIAMVPTRSIETKRSYAPALFVIGLVIILVAVGTAAGALAARP